MVLRVAQRIFLALGFRTVVSGRRHIGIYHLNLFRYQIVTCRHIVAPDRLIERIPAVADACRSNRGHASSVSSEPKVGFRGWFSGARGKTHLALGCRACSGLRCLAGGSSVIAGHRDYLCSALQVNPGPVTRIQFSDRPYGGPATLEYSRID